MVDGASVVVVDVVVVTGQPRSPETKSAKFSFTVQLLKRKQMLDLSLKEYQAHSALA